MTGRSSLVLDERGMQPFSRRNYLAHCIEGGLFLGGAAFIHTDIVMPALLERLGTSQWLISYAPTLGILGFVIPAILVAHLIERMRRLKQAVAFMGVLQRLPFVVSALLLFLLPGWSGNAWWVGTSWLISGLLGGFTAAAWLGLVIKVIPENRRASSSAIRFILQAGIGLFASFAISWILGSCEGLRGYAWLHVIASALLFGSTIIFMTIRETPAPLPENHQRLSLTQNLRLMPSLLRETPQLLRFISLRMLSMAIFVSTPLLSRYVLSDLGESDAYLGHLVRMQMFGSIFGNIVAAVLGDKLGGKSVLLMAYGLLLCSLTCCFIGGNALVYDAMYLCYGAGFFMLLVALDTLAMELAPQKSRITALALCNASQAPALLLAGALCSLCTLTPQPILTAVCISAGFLLMAILVLSKLREPRQTVKNQSEIHASS